MLNWLLYYVMLSVVGVVDDYNGDDGDDGSGGNQVGLTWTVDKLQLFTATNDCSDNVWGWNKIELSGRRNSFVHMYRAGNHIIIHTNTQTRTQLSTRAYAPCAKFSVNFDLRFSFFSCQLSTPQHPPLVTTVASQLKKKKNRHGTATNILWKIRLTNAND